MDWATVVTAIVTYFGGAATMLIPLLFERPRQFLLRLNNGPWLSVSYADSPDHNRWDAVYAPMLTFDEMESGRVSIGRQCHVRLKVENKGIVHAAKCCGFITAIVKEEVDGKNRHTRLEDSFQMHWAFVPDGEEQAIDVREGVPQWLDVCNVFEGETRITPRTLTTPSLFQQLFSTPGHYRFGVTVTAERAPPAKTYLRVSWFGTEEGLKVRTLTKREFESD